MKTTQDISPTTPMATSKNLTPAKNSTYDEFPAHRGNFFTAATI